MSNAMVKITNFENRAYDKMVELPSIEPDCQVRY